MSEQVRGLPAKLVVLILFLCFLPCGIALAQTVNGAFHGTITDPTGAVIPGATVVVKNLATGAVRQADSDAAGFYTLTQIPPAIYSITISRTGFTTLVQPKVELLVAEDREASFALQLGQTTQQVQVTGTTAALNTSNSTLGTVVGSTQVVDLP